MALPAPSPRTLQHLRFNDLLDALAARTRTPQGRARALALPFLDREEEIERSLARIEESQLLLHEELTLPVGQLESVESLLSNAHKGGMLEPLELVACAALMRSASRVRAFVRGRAAVLPLLDELSAELPDEGELAARIESSFEPSGRLKDHASAQLGELRDRARGLHGRIKQQLEGMLADASFAGFLRDTYHSIRNDRYVVPVNASFRAKVPGIVHNASNTGQTIFVEPDALIGMGNDLAIAESLVAEEERRILLELSALVGARADALSAAALRLGELDCIEASAKLGVELQASRPQLVDGREGFSLRGLRHPLLVLQGKRVVANDVALGKGQRALVISGPNAGGKTVTLTAIGLCALLTRAGLQIPAEPGSVVPLYRALHSAIGDAQDLARDLSSFSAHLTVLREILEAAGERVLVLVDEIAADTDPREGAALATAVLEELVRKGAQVLVTTHLEELKAMALADARFGNARVGLDPTTFAPTFRLQLGQTGVSSALSIARRVGLPEAVLTRAQEALHGGSALAVALGALETERLAAERARLALDEERESFARARDELAQAKSSAEAARLAAEVDVRAALRAEVEATRHTLGEALAKLTAQPKVADVVRLQAELKDREDALARSQARVEVEAQVRAKTPAPMSPVRPGMRVRVVSLNKDGEVLELGRSDALVALGGMKLRLKLDDLVPLGPPKRAAPVPSKPTRSAEAMAPAALVGSEARCDIRGLRAEDALREVERFLDRAYSEGPALLHIVHGLGSGALKQAVREALGSSPYVSGARPGERHQGGDGVTVVELRG